MLCSLCWRCWRLCHEVAGVMEVMCGVVEVVDGMQHVL